MERTLASVKRAWRAIELSGTVYSLVLVTRLSGGVSGVGGVKRAISHCQLRMMVITKQTKTKKGRIAVSSDSSA